MNFILEFVQKIFTATLFSLGGTPISISSIIELIFSLFLVIFIARILSNLLKQRVLTKLGVDEGNREAIAVIVRYFSIIIGIIIVLQGIGFNLTSLAVVAGGLGVGIGFGIQDLTTNFVSGLTLLLDRPVKVGDYVELEGLSGTVKEVSIRSTIIKTNDDSSVIVPNSNMISSKIVNWSYDNSILCLRIPVEVADNSDPLLVTETLLNTAYSEPAVLHEPNPKVLFSEFGDNCFKFKLLVWINRPKEQEYIKSSLNFAIEYNFRQQGIAFPANPTDLWLRNPEVLGPIFQENGLKSLADEDWRALIYPVEETLAPVTLPVSDQLSLRDALHKVKYFENFSDLELRQLIEAGYRQKLQPSQMLFRENDPGDAFYIILSGSVEVFVEKINKHLTNLTAGQFLGELSLMLGIPRTASVRALENTTLFAINKNGFQKILKEQPELSEQIIQELSRNQEELSQRQKQLRALGLVDDTEDDQNPVDWVRKRLQNLFSLAR
ncbi:MAG TPA: mechanosensitive ion channel protein MscS [Cyanobacteria bacterium UBA11149]|nr:mechanosensitive ion channel protein MscS [Cyanobacteria bacterium UBA11367]HBE58269.1 mechanosensitive ion channel protein MscS [Cyanobacteria bacterium UBA11366]HBK63969.1 mechanosensitive ion channel protein MscS [Cyanobacteria bacterium UBA11166]HBR73849.1 mechanosensitive ion channel protein MscS [Cyanobacteria bacterium UBA11159]HBS71237.1 mechanosensitive ion channel protein MscS [Cyanobacteria bacterium UBA11153]HBW87322.1 mechanosensitive ion channel protein MscS [Cyanobacteria bac